MKKILCLLLGMLICVMTVDATPAAFGEALTEKCPDMAVCGRLVWRVDDMVILCEDVEAGAIRATLPLSECLQPDEKLLRVSVAAWAEDSVLLALYMSDSAIRLLELGLAEGAIRVIKEYSASDQLGFLTDNKVRWYEVNMIGCGRRLFIAALDDTYRFHFFAYTPDTGALVPLGERSLATYTAAMPYDGDLLIAGPSEADESLLELTRLSLDDGSTQLLDAIALDSALHAANFAWDGSEGLLYCSINNMVYALSPGSAEAPKAVGTLNSAPAELRLGVVSGDRYAALSESGQLLSCDIHSPVAFTAQLRIANCVDDEIVVAAARDFGVDHPGCTASVADIPEETNLLSELKAHPSEYDAYVLDLRSDLYRSLGESGFVADLSGIDALASAASDMTPRMAKALQMDGHLCAVPTAVGSYCQLLNVPDVQLLTGLSPEEIPTDWPDFFGLLGQLADSGALTADGEYRLFGADMPADGLRDMVFGSMLQDCLLWLEADDSAAERLPQALLPTLEAFNRVNWSRLSAIHSLPPLSQPGAASGDFQLEPYDSSRTALLDSGMPDITVAPQAEGMAYWPLSVEPGGERLISQVAFVLCVNPHSKSPEAALSFAAHVWEKTNVETKMALCQSMNTPVANAAYQEDLDYMAQDAALLKQDIAEAQSAEAQTSLQAQLDDLQAYMEDYRNNGQWLASEASIARYRSLAGALVPIAPDFGFDDALSNLMFQFLDGGLTPEEYAERFAQAVR